MKRKPQVGDTFKTNNHGRVTIVSYANYLNVEVAFSDGTRANVQMGNLRRGQVCNNTETYHGVGYGVRGGRYSVKSHGSIYSVWNDMLDRCYSGKHPGYYDCTVAKRWHNFQNFAKDYEQLIGYGIPSWQLDKDILVQGNRRYSRHTCCLVPNVINSLIMPRKNRALPTGVSRAKKVGWYNAFCSVDGDSVYLGRYSSIVEASESYREFKLATIKKVAKMFRKQLDPRVYTILMEKTL